MSESFEDIEWWRLTHAYGSAENIPKLIGDLRSEDPAVWVVGLSELYDTLCHQMCSIYPATLKVIPFLIQLLGDKSVLCRGRILQFLADIVLVAKDWPEHNDDGQTHSPQELNQQIHDLVRRGMSTYLGLVSDLDPRIRIIAPYVLGAIATGPNVPDELQRRFQSRMTQQFDEEPNDLVRASLVFGMSCLSIGDDEIKCWLNERFTSGQSCAAVKFSAALNLVESNQPIPNPIFVMLVELLKDPEGTNQLFTALEPGIENRYHPIGRAVLRLQDKLVVENDMGKAEDIKFPWVERWEYANCTTRILELLAAGKTDQDQIKLALPTLLSVIEATNEYTSDSQAIPIYRYVFGNKRLSLDTDKQNLLVTEKKVLLTLFNNLDLWATEMYQEIFDLTGLGNRRELWAKMLNVNPRFSEIQIKEILKGKLTKQRCSSASDLTELRLCCIGSDDFLTFMTDFTNLKILDFSDTPLTDDSLVEIAKFSQLEKVRLNNTHITDSGVEHLIKLTSLEEIYLGGTKITDQSLRALQSMPKLQFVYVGNTDVTEQAIQGMIRHRTNCRVSY